MPVPEDDQSPVEILNSWAEVGLSDEGTFKYVLIEVYATETISGNFNTRNIKNHPLYFRPSDFRHPNPLYVPQVKYYLHYYRR